MWLHINTKYSILISLINTPYWYFRCTSVFPNWHFNIIYTIYRANIITKEYFLGYFPIPRMPFSPFQHKYSCTGTHTWLFRYRWRAALDSPSQHSLRRGTIAVAPKGHPESHTVPILMLGLLPVFPRSTISIASIYGWIGNWWRNHIPNSGCSI